VSFVLRRQVFKRRKALVCSLILQKFQSSVLQPRMLDKTSGLDLNLLICDINYIYAPGSAAGLFGVTESVGRRLKFVLDSAICTLVYTPIRQSVAA